MDVLEPSAFTVHTTPSESVSVTEDEYYNRLLAGFGEIAVAAYGATAVVVPCLWLWGLLLSLGFISDAKPWALHFEMFRLLLMTPAAASFGDLPYALPVAIAYVTTSVLALAYYLINTKHRFEEINSKPNEIRKHA